MENIIELGSKSGLLYEFGDYVGAKDIPPTTDEFISRLTKFAELLLASQAVSEPVAWSLQWPDNVIDGSVNYKTTFESESAAKKYINDSNHSHYIKAVPLFLHDTIKSVSDERAEFQKAMKDKYGWNALDVLDNRGKFSDMVYQHVFYAFAGWQARAQLNPVTSLSENEQDAKRYRWLRELISKPKNGSGFNHANTLQAELWHRGYDRDASPTRMVYPIHAELDDFIDQAITNQKGK